MHIMFHAPVIGRSIRKPVRGNYPLVLDGPLDEALSLCIRSSCFLLLSDCARIASNVGGFCFENTAAALSTEG